MTHFSHVKEEMESAYNPAAQSAQMEYPDEGAEVPFGQSKQEVVKPNEFPNFPGEHGMHSLSKKLPVDGWYFPKPQEVHSLV